MTITKQLAATLLILLLIGLAPGSALGFSDTRGHWARAQMDHLKSRELLSGYPDGSFRPDAYVTREELVTLIIKALHKEQEAQQLARGEGSFLDTRQRWSRGFVDLARELNITQGDGKDYFHPQRIVTRQEAVTLLVNALKEEELPEEGPNPFKDGEDIETWARQAVAYAYTHGLIKGFPDGSFQPLQAVTRGQVAMMLEQFLNLRGQKWHLAGTIASINLSLRQVTLEIEGKSHQFELAENVSVYRSGQPEPVTELALPARGYFDLNRQGKLAYALLVDELPPAAISVQTRKLPLTASPARVQDPVVKLALDEIESPRRSVLDRPGASLENTRQAMGVDKFIKQTGATGRGQLVAVIDSGIDPGHPDLQTTVDGYPTLVDFLDFTDEGKIDLSRTAQPVNDEFAAEKLTVNVEGITNAAGDFRYGFLDTSVFPASFRAHWPASRLLVVLAASRYWYDYDTVYIDTDGDGDLSDEKPLGRYSPGQYATIVNLRDRQLNLAVTEIGSKPAYVKLSFDGLGHGTEVAGIVAAHGKVVGMAPGAQLLAVKVLNRIGQSNIKVVEQALEAAGQRGARIAVISMGQYRLSSPDHERLAAVAESMWKKYHMIICMAAGNNGPGISTVARSSSVSNVISVGAYATPRMWYRDYGWKVEEPTLWYISSAGPSADGLLTPTVLAPGNAVSTFPLWGDMPYWLDQGTSMAAPHVAGAVALLLDVATHQLYQHDTLAVYQALLSGAVKLPQLQPAEQGLGVVNVVKAWEALQDPKDSFTAYQVRQYTPHYGYGKGLYSRGVIPARLSVQIQNTSDSPRQLAVGGLADWIKPSQYWLQIPASSQRRINIDYEGLDEPGLYSQFLVADDMDTPGTDLNILQTILVPYDLQALPQKTLSQEGSLRAGQFKRYFIRVPEETGQLVLNLEIGSKGRGRMHVISPLGWQEISSYAGVGDVNIREAADLTFNQPIAGVWEVVVYSSATLSTYDLKSTQYTLQASLKEVRPVTIKKPDDRYLITTVPPTFTEGETTANLTLHFWHPATKTPVQGAVMINDRLYELEQGTVMLKVAAQEGPVDLDIAW